MAASRFELELNKKMFIKNKTGYLFGIACFVYIKFYAFNYACSANTLVTKSAASLSAIAE